MVLACTVCTDSHACSWSACLTSGALVNSIQARMTQLAGRRSEGWMDEAPGAPNRARTAVTAARCVGGPPCSTHMRRRCALPFSSFLLLPLLPLRTWARGACCATSRAAVSRHTVISVPGWPTCRRHRAPTGKASQCHPIARETPHVVVEARIVRDFGRPIKVF